MSSLGSVGHLEPLTCFPKKMHMMHSSGKPVDIPPIPGMHSTPGPKPSTCPMVDIVAKGMKKGGDPKCVGSQALLGFAVYEGTKKKLGIDTSQAPPEVAALVGATSGLAAGESVAVARIPTETVKNFAPSILGKTIDTPHLSPGQYFKVLTRVPPEYFVRSLTEATHGPRAVLPALAGAAYEGGKALVSQHMKEMEEEHSKKQEQNRKGPGMVDVYDPFLDSLVEKEKLSEKESHVCLSLEESSKSSDIKTKPSLLTAVFDETVNDVDSGSDEPSSSTVPGSALEPGSGSETLSGPAQIENPEPKEDQDPHEEIENSEPKSAGGVGSGVGSGEGIPSLSNPSGDREPAPVSELASQVDSYI